MSNMTLDSTFQTTDLPLAVTLSLFFPLFSTDSRDRSRIIFIYKREDGLDTFLESYWAGKIRVEPRAYFEQIKFLKARLYER